MALRNLNQIHTLFPLRLQNARVYSWLPWSKKDKDKSEITDLLEESVSDAVTPSLDTDDSLRKEIDSKRNKSRLNEQHRRILFGMRPYDESIEWYHDTVKYKKRMLGRYGLKGLDVPAGVLWPTPAEVEEQKEYIRVAYPLTLQESWTKIKKDKEEKEAKIRARDDEIAEKVKQADDWIRKLHIKLEEKKNREEAAKADRERLIEEVRKQFNFHISVNDERFKEALLLLEKQEKKQKKEARRQARQDKYLSQLNSTETVKQEETQTE